MGAIANLQDANGPDRRVIYFAYIGEGEDCINVALHLELTDLTHTQADAMRLKRVWIITRDQSNAGIDESSAALHEVVDVLTSEHR